MKPKSNPFVRIDFKSTALIRYAALSLGLSFAGLSTQSASAASATWNGTTDALWATGTNWSTTPVPGTGDTATFNNAGGTIDTIDLGTGLVINTVLFDTASAAAYTLGTGAVGSQALTLNNAGAVIMNAAVATNQLVNANLTLSNAAAATTTVTNNGSGLLTVAGGIAANVASGNGLLALGGTGNTTVSGAVSKPGAGSNALKKTGSGIVTLSNGSVWNGAGATQTANALTSPFIVQEGILLLSGGAHTITGEVVVGGVTTVGGAGQNAKLQLDAGSLGVSTYISLGRGNGTGSVSSDLVLNNAATASMANFSAGYNGNSTSNLPKGSVALNGSSVFTVTGNGVFRLGESSGANIAMTMGGSSNLAVTGTGTHRVGEIGSTGALTLNDTATATFGGTTAVGYGAGSSGTLTINGGAVTTGVFYLAQSTTATDIVTGTATVNTGGTLKTTGDSSIGLGGSGATGAAGTLTISGGTVEAGFGTTRRWLKMGEFDTGKGTINITSGALKIDGNTDVRTAANNINVGSTNTITQSGGTVTFYSDAGTTVGGDGVLDMQTFGSAAMSSIYNLDGGTLTANKVTSTYAGNANPGTRSTTSTNATGTRTFNFNGGTLKAASATYAADFFNLGSGPGTARANIRNGGAIIDTNGLSVATAQSFVHSNIGGDATTDGGLTKQGSGTLALSAVSTYTGATSVTGGTLSLTGSSGINASSGITISGSGAKLVHNSGTAISAPVTLAQGALDGTGTVNNTLTVANSTGNTISAGNGGAGTLTVDTLSFQGAATVNMRANGTVSDQFLVVTNLATSGSPKVTVNASNTTGVWTSGIVYPVVSFASYSSAPDASHFVLAPVPGLNPNQSATLVNDGGSIGILITGESLIWNGSPGNSNWTIGGSTNWSYVGNPIGFSDNSPVVFNDSAASHDVNLGQNVTPSAIVFDNSSDYTVSSTGGFGITTGTLVLNGFGKVTVGTANTFTGATTINAGILEISGAGSIATSSSITDNGELVFDLSGPSNIYSNPITGTGSVTKKGGGALTLSGANTFSGSLVLNAGLLNVNSAGALGNTPGTIEINGGTLDNTSGSAVTSVSNRPQTWSGDVTFTGSGSLAMGTGAVTLFGTGSSRTVNVGGNTLGVGAIGGSGFGLVKTGSGTLNMNGANITGKLDIQGGVVGTRGFVYAAGFLGSGVLQSSGAAFTTNWTHWSITTDQTSGGLLRNNDGSIATTQLAIVKRGTATWTLTNNANNATGTLNVDNGRLVLDNTGTYGAQNGDATTNTGLTAVVGWDAGANAVLEIKGATVNFNNRNNAGTEAYRATLNVGNNGTGAGALVLNSGSLATNKALNLGVTNGAFAAMTQTGGSSSVGGFLALGVGTSKGVLNLGGGTFTHTGPVTAGANPGGVGVINIGGTASYNCNNTSPYGFWIGEGGTGTLNVSASGALTLNSAGSGMELAHLAGGSGTVNLLGGTVTAKSVTQGAGTGTLNFNGGTLAANAASTTFLTGLTKACVHSGGGTINNGGNAITIGQSLLAPTGNGLSASGLTVSGGGYIATPQVSITGDGTGATAVASIDGSGNLTGITMTNPGVGYTTATFALVGGGIGNTGSIGGSVSLVANASGGMTFSGSGITTLSGTSTYTGNTTVTAGTISLADNAGLKFAIGANQVNNKITGAGAATLDGDFTFDLTGGSIANGNSWTLVDTAAKSFTANFTVVGFSEVSNVWTKIDGNNTWSFDEANGKLTLTVAAGGYDSWKGANAGGQPADQDYDLDGVENGVEYFMNAAAGFTANPSVVVSGAGRTVTWSNGGNIPASAYGTRFVIQTSADLVTWTDVPVGNLTTNTDGPGGALAYTLTGAGSSFVRLKVVPD